MSGFAGLNDMDALSPCVDATILPALLAVLTEFDRKKISYCYWKSSRVLASVLAGDGDVDLLIERDHQHRAAAILIEGGFKFFPSVAIRDHPAIASFLGYDETSGRLIHLHLHFRLIVGERLLKNYRVPWEGVILERARRHPMFPIRIIDPASEALLCVVRACLELRRLDPITLRNWQATKRKFAYDQRLLAVSVDRSVLRQLAARLLGEDLADAVCSSILVERGLEDQRRLRRRVRGHFAANRTYNALEARLRAVGRAVLWALGSLNKHLLQVPRPWSRRTPGGGCVTAFIGIDGSGKTTVVAAVRAWLGSEIDVVPIYFGTGAGRPSLFLRPFKLMVSLITPLIGSKPKGASHGRISSDPPGVLYGVLLTVWATVVAVEKRVKLLAARRGADRGLVVLADRYPQNEILDFNDGPLLTRLLRVPRWLRRFEAGTYALARRLPPDLVIKLEVTPETAARREPNMDPAVIRTRIAAVPRLAFPGARVVCIDAEQPLADVIRAVKDEIWRLL